MNERLTEMLLMIDFSISSVSCSDFLSSVGAWVVVVGEECVMLTGGMGLGLLPPRVAEIEGAWTGLATVRIVGVVFLVRYGRC